jgi:hypothetical protein
MRAKIPIRLTPPFKRPFCCELSLKRARNLPTVPLRGVAAILEKYERKSAQTGWKEVFVLVEKLACVSKMVRCWTNLWHYMQSASPRSHLQLRVLRHALSTCHIA